MSYPYIIQGNNIVVVIGANSHTINKGHIAYQKVLDAIKASDWETVKNTVEPKKVIISYGAGNISIKGETLYWKGQEFHNSLSRRMIQMFQDGFSIEPMVLFMENLMENSSYRAVNELYEFLEKNTLPITPDGHFLAYKKVCSDYMDVHSKTVPNKVAATFTDEEKANMPIIGGRKKEVTISIENDVTVVSMPRNQVNDDKNQTCSEGLHFCSKEYLSNFGGEKTMILKINPRDVVSIPTDYNRSKGRACRYEIIAELGVNPEEAFDEVVMTTSNG
jgi:ribosomal protein S17E